MRKRKKGRKLSRVRIQRKALMKNLANAFFLHQKISTTEAKAKEAQPFLERLIHRAKSGDLASRRYAARFLTPQAVRVLFSDIASQMQERNGGYTRVTKLKIRKADAARMAMIELVESESRGQDSK